MSIHEWIKTGLSAVNTTIIVVGAIFAYNEFIDKSDSYETNRAEETYSKLQAMTDEGSGFLFPYLFDENPMPQGLQTGGPTPFQEGVDKALGSYYSVALCVESGKCDPKVVARLICPFLLNDARIINRTFGKEISNGGTFIDRPRIWSFYEQVEFCLENVDSRRIDHESFLARFQDDVDLLNDADRAMFGELKNKGWNPGPPPDGQQ